MRIVVKQEHIKSGIHKSPISCPIARAVREAFGVDDVGATHYSIYVAGKRYEVPDSVQSFIKRFDDGEVVEPFEFELKES